MCKLVQILSDTQTAGANKSFIQIHYAKCRVMFLNVAWSASDQTSELISMRVG
jgi:hypothetical protein